MTDSPKDTSNLEDTAGRPSLEDLRTFSYNRIKVPTDLKSQICSQIADSSESLPLWQTEEYDGSHDNPSAAKNPIPDASDIPTPIPEKGNPMDQLPLDKQKTATPLSNVSTRQSIDSKEGKDRPGTLRRFTTRIKRSISSNPSK